MVGVFACSPLASHLSPYILGFFAGDVVHNGMGCYQTNFVEMTLRKFYMNYSLSWNGCTFFFTNILLSCQVVGLVKTLLFSISFLPTDLMNCDRQCTCMCNYVQCACAEGRGVANNTWG